MNLYEKPSYKSKISSQIIYGEKFKILSKKKGWLKIKTAFDKYVGYTKNIKYSNKFSPTHKISVQKTNIFSFPKFWLNHHILKEKPCYFISYFFSSTAPFFS